MKSTRRNIYVPDRQWMNLSAIAIEESAVRGTQVTISDIAREGFAMRIRLGEQRRKKNGGTQL